jgi:hypothetical protein
MAPPGVASRTREAASATHTVPEGKIPKPKVDEKVAAAPKPSVPPEALLPARVEDVHTRPAGSAVVPLPLHAAGQVQGVGGAAPPAQKKPGLQGAPSGAVEPAAQPLPGRAAQGPLQAALASPVVLPKRPAGQGRKAPPPP